jgi:hypothetical protein
MHKLPVQNQEQQINSIPVTGVPHEPLTTIPNRTRFQRASISNWQAMPQFQPDLNAAPRWYALENEANPDYWKNVVMDQVIICLEKGESAKQLSPLIQQFGLTPGSRSSMHPEIVNYYTYNLPGGTKSSMLELIRAAQSYPFILFAEPVIIYKSFSCIPNDPDFFSPANQQGAQWAPYLVWADSAWCYTTGANSFEVVAVIDNAVDYNHSDLTGIVAYGWDYADNDGDPAPDDPSQETHGTHVTGISSARINNGIGIAGLCNDTVYFAKAANLFSGGFPNQVLVDALNDISTISRVRVINMSLGSTSPSAAIEAACNNAFSSGKLLVAAAGNDGNNVTQYPAGYPSVISVGSVDANFTISNFSSFGTNQELTAPGGDGNPPDAGDIWSTYPLNSYAFLPGTSMASPLVSGIAGLMFARNPSATNTIVRTIMQQCVVDQGTPGWDQFYGYGVLMADCATILVSDQEISASEIAFNVFPNPGRGVFKIRIPDFNDEADLEVFNAMGERVVYEKIFSGIGEVDLSGNANGIYLLRISNSDGAGVTRINLNR